MAYRPISQSRGFSLISSVESSVASRVRGARRSGDHFRRTLCDAQVAAYGTEILPGNAAQFGLEPTDPSPNWGSDREIRVDLIILSDYQ